MRLGVLSDLHWSDGVAHAGAWHNPYDFAGLPRRLAEAKERFAAEDVQAVCLLGDLTHHGSQSALSAFARSLGDLEVPIVTVAGNHDAAGTEALAAALPGVHLADPTGTLIGKVRLAGIHVAPGGWFRARPEAPPAVAAWGEELTVLLSHYPVLSHALRLSSRGMPYPGDLVGRAEIAAALADRSGPTVVLSGHIHARDSLSDGGVLQLTQAAFVEAPYECAIVEIAVGEQLIVTRRAYALTGEAPQAPDLPVFVPANARFAHNATGWHATATSDRRGDDRPTVTGLVGHPLT